MKSLRVTQRTQSSRVTNENTTTCQQSISYSAGCLQSLCRFLCSRHWSFPCSACQSPVRRFCHRCFHLQPVILHAMPTASVFLMQTSAPAIMACLDFLVPSPAPRTDTDSAAPTIVWGSFQSLFTCRCLWLQLHPVQLHQQHHMFSLSNRFHGPKLRTAMSRGDGRQKLRNHLFVHVRTSALMMHRHVQQQLRKPMHSKQCLCNVQGRIHWRGLQPSHHHYNHDVDHNIDRTELCVMHIVRRARPCTWIL